MPGELSSPPFIVETIPAREYGASLEWGAPPNESGWRPWFPLSFHSNRFEALLEWQNTISHSLHLDRDVANWRIVDTNP